MESAVKALVHLAGRQREPKGHDISRLCAQLVEPYHEEVIALIGPVGADKLTRWRQYSRYSPARLSREPLTPEFVRDMAEVARKMAAYTVERFGDGMVEAALVGQAVATVEHRLNRYDLETGTRLSG